MSNDWLFNEHIRRRLTRPKGYAEREAERAEGHHLTDVRMVLTDTRTTKTPYDGFNIARGKTRGRMQKRGRKSPLPADENGERPDPMYAANHRAGLYRASLNDIDLACWRIEPDGSLNVLCVVEAMSYPATNYEAYLATSLRDLLEEGPVRRLQIHLLRGLARQLDCPALFVAYPKDGDLSRDDETLYVARLDDDAPRWCRTTVGAYLDRLRALCLEHETV